MNFPKPIHPFPARMAPSIVLNEVQALPKGSVVLDPMMGSGTVIRVAADQGHYAYGCDVDPLAVLVTRVWTSLVDTRHIYDTALQLVEEAQKLTDETLAVPWIDDDPTTQSFVNYWFDKPQQTALRCLSTVLHPLNSSEADVLRVALSKIIITKNQGASLARDVSHSRPHRAFKKNAYLVYEGFLQAVQKLAKRLEQEPPPGNAYVEMGDARNLAIPDSSIDTVITSPPYLNAIDYLRGHRMALVWLGYRIPDLRTIRSDSIGAERAPNANLHPTLTADILEQMQLDEALPRRYYRMIERYILDLHAMLLELHRVMRQGGRVLFVLGDSCIKGVFVRNSVAVAALAQHLGFEEIDRQERVLPPSRRYLPPPTSSAGTALDRRMRTEIVTTYVR